MRATTPKISNLEKQAGTERAKRKRRIRRPRGMIKLSQQEEGILKTEQLGRSNYTLSSTLYYNK